MHRRSLLQTTALTLAIGFPGCAALRPDIRMDSGSGVLHPASDQVIDGGLEAEGDNHLFATTAPDQARNLLGPDAPDSIVDALQNPGVSEKFHAVVQLRSIPAAPKDIWPVTGSAFAWEDRSTLRATVTIDPWGSDDLDERLRTADELIYTGVWDLTPRPAELPAELVVESSR